MSKRISPLRPAMTAVAAVIALSSTQLLAQTADSASDQAAPVIAAPPPPTVTPDVSTTASQIAVPEIATPAPAMRTMSTPVVHTADADTSVAPEATARPKHAPTASARAATPVSAAATPRIAPEAQPVTPASTPAPATPPAAIRSEPAPVAKTATVQTARAQSVDEDVAPIVGAVGLGVLAIGGVAFAFRRRKRRDDANDMAFEPTQETAAIVSAEPVSMEKVRKTRSTTATLPNGFDISHFGRHTQAAYRGPTPDNPSHSLRRRLSRASFFDQREREAAEAAAAAKTAAPKAAATARKTATAERDDHQVTVRMAPSRKRSKLGFAFQK
jgi:resuscitation-promoting factor RpfA